MGGSEPGNFIRWSSADTGGISGPAVVSRKVKKVKKSKRSGDFCSRGIIFSHEVAEFE